MKRAIPGEIREHRDSLVARVQRLVGLILALLGVIWGSFWYVQIARGEYYRALAENNRLRKKPEEALRGLIYDRHRRLLAENIPSYNLLLDRSRSDGLEASLEFAATILEIEPAELGRRLERYRGVQSFTPVLIAEDLNLSEVARFEAESLGHPEFEIEVHPLRLYRHGPQTAHVLGYLGEATQEDLAREPEDVTAGDLVGRKGIERAYDHHLRGHAGERVVVVDSRGKVLEETVRQPSRPGRDLVLALDLELQQTAERLMRERVGAVVALDPRDGAVLALVSSPSYDPNLFARRLNQRAWQELLAAPHDPLQSRPVQNTYSPGSVFKIVMAMAGLEEGVVSPGERVWCGGSVNLYGQRRRCWHRGGHGWVNLREALKHSCDVYFYLLGQKLEIERIARQARLFGLGAATGIDLTGEKVGLVPDAEWSLRARSAPWFAGETLSVAIGQGPLLVTPLQVASLMAVVANGGSRVTPHLALGEAPPPRPIAGLPGASLERVRDALRAVVNEPGGTGANAAVAGLEVAGKTATVQVISQKTWTDSAELPYEQRDHAWFASFAPLDDPRLVVVVFVEHGGKGSQAAAPIARALYETYFETDPRRSTVR